MSISTSRNPLIERLLKERADLTQHIIRVEQMIDVELDPGSPLYQELRALLTKLKGMLIK